MATAAHVSRPVPYVRDQKFFVRFAVAIAVVTVFCFAQLVARGLVDPRDAPIWVHLHAAAMVGWLALLVVQTRLATQNVQLHRRVGKAGVMLAFAIVGLGWFTVLKSFQLHRNLPGYSDAWFLAQTAIESIAFISLVMWAIVLRHDPQSHRRLMLGATIIAAINPAIARLLPGSISGSPGSGWLMLAAEAGLTAILLSHDRKVLGVIHPATVWVGSTLGACQILMIAGGYSPAVMSVAKLIAAS